MSLLNITAATALSLIAEKYYYSISVLNSLIYRYNPIPLDLYVNIPYQSNSTVDQLYATYNNNKQTIINIIDWVLTTKNPDVYQKDYLLTLKSQFTTNLDVRSGIQNISNIPIPLITNVRDLQNVINTKEDITKTINETKNNMANDIQNKEQFDKKIQEYENLLKNLNDIIDDLRLKLSNLMQENNRLIAEIKQNNIDFAKKNESIVTINNFLNQNLNNVIDKPLIDNIRDLYDRYTRETVLTSELSKKLNESSNIELNKEIAGLNGANELLKKQLTATKQFLDKINVENESNKETIEQLNNRLETSTHIIDDNTIKINELENSTKSAIHTMNEYDINLQNQIKYNNNLKNQIKDLNDVNQKIITENNKYETELNNFDQYHRNTIDSLNEQKNAQLKFLSDKNKQLSTELNTISDQFKNQTANITKQYEQLQNDALINNEKQKEMVNTINTLTEENKEYANKVNNFDNKMIALRDELNDNYQFTIETWKNKSIDLQNKLNDANNQIININKDLTNKNSTLDQINQILLKHNNNIQFPDNIVDNINNKLNSYEEQMNEYRNIVDSYDQAIKQHDQEISQYKETIEVYKNDLNEKDKIITNLNGANHDLIEDYNKQINNYKQQINDADLINKDLINNYTEQINNANTEINHLKNSMDTIRNNLRYNVKYEIEDDYSVINILPTNPKNPQIIQ